MKILLLGALGHIGTALTTELTARGHTLLLADRAHSSLPNYVKCDIAQYRQLESVFVDDDYGFDFVYNLAAEFGRRNGEEFYESLWQTNVVGFKHILTLQQQHCFKLIHFSSSEVYGDYPGVMAEDVMENCEVRQLNDYAMTKWVNEMQAINAAAEYGTETVRVRLFNTYGPGEHYSPYRSAIAIFCHCALHGLPYTVYVNHQRTSSYITDTCLTLANIVDNFKPGEVYNIGGTRPHSMWEVSWTILNQLGLKDEMVTYKRAEPFTTHSKLVDVSRAVRDLGHAPQVELEEGIAKTLEWMRGLK